MISFDYGWGNMDNKDAISEALILVGQGMSVLKAAQQFGLPADLVYQELKAKRDNLAARPRLTACPCCGTMVAPERIDHSLLVKGE